MKTKLFQIVLSAIVLCLSAVTFAQLKIAVVSVNEAAMATEEAKESLKDIETKFAPEQDRLRDIQAEMIQLRDKLLNDEAVTSDSERQTILKNVEDLQFELEQGAQKLQRDLTEERDLLMSSLNPKFQKAVRDLVALENYDMVYQYNPNVLLYVNPKHDITRKVTEVMNDITE